MEFSINGTKILVTPKQSKAIMRMLFSEAEEEATPENSKVEAIKEKRKGKKKYNAILGKRLWTPEMDAQLLKRHKELSHQPNENGQVKIYPTLAKEFNRSVSSLSVRVSMLKNKK